MPAGQPHVVSIAVLLRTVFVAHPRAAAPEERIQATERHSLIAIPIGHVLTGLTVFRQALAVEAFTQGVAVLFAYAVDVARLNDDGLGFSEVSVVSSLDCLPECIVCSLLIVVRIRVGLARGCPVALADQVVALGGDVLDDGLVFGDA